MHSRAGPLPASPRHVSVPATTEIVHCVGVLVEKHLRVAAVELADLKTSEVPGWGGGGGVSGGGGQREASQLAEVPSIGVRVFA